MKKTDVLQNSKLISPHLQIGQSKLAWCLIQVKQNLFYVQAKKCLREIRTSSKMDNSRILATASHWKE